MVGNEVTTEVKGVIVMLVLEWKIVCQSCERTIRLPEAVALQRPRSPSGVPAPQLPAAIACPSCGFVAIYDHFDPPDTREIEPSIRRAGRIRLTCGVAGCDGNLIVTAVSNHADCQEEVKTWVFSERVCCSNGHRFGLPSPIVHE
jgi:hypothetical protein